VGVIIARAVTLHAGGEDSGAGSRQTSPYRITEGLPVIQPKFSADGCWGQRRFSTR
jgi:hypothetical protein